MISSFFKALLVALVTFIAVAQADLPVYDASIGGSNPANQDWLGVNTTVGSDSQPDGLIDTGPPANATVGPVAAPNSAFAWQINDSSDDDLSVTYTQSFAAGEQQQLYNAGFRLKIRLRAVANHTAPLEGQSWSGAFLLEFPASVTGTGNRRIGFILGVGTGDQFQIFEQSTDATFVARTEANSVDQFHCLGIVKAAGVSEYDWSLNGIHQQTLDLNNGLSFTGANNLVQITSGASSIDGGVFDIQSLHLEEVLPGEILYVDAHSSNPVFPYTSWNTAAASLQDALAVAASGDQIWVADGTYSPATGTDRDASFVLRSGVAIYGGFTGVSTGPTPGSEETSLAERNPDPLTNGTLLSGDLNGDDDPQDSTSYSENSFHVVTGTRADATTILDGFTIRSGNADDPGEVDRNHLGGGLTCDGSGSPTLRNLLFEKNQASGVGGAVYLNEADATFENVIFLDNKTLFTGSGVVGEGGAGYFNNCDPIFTDCRFLGNSSTSSGGAVSHHVSDARYTNCVFSGNQCQGFGSAIYSTSNSDPTLINCSVTGNLNPTNAPTSHAISQNGGTLHAFNTIVWKNLYGAEIDLTTEVGGSGGTLDFSHSLVKNQGASEPGNLDGTDSSNNPLFTDPDGLDDIFGTLDDDLALESGSPALNVGDATVVTVSSDLDGNPRIIGAPDLGVFERAPIFVDLSAVGGSNNGTSWTDAYLSVANALSVHGGTAATEVFLVATGTYTQGGNSDATIPLEGAVLLYGGYDTANGAEPAFAERDPFAHPTILSGDFFQSASTADDNHHVITAFRTIDPALLDGFTIEKGNAPNNSPGSAIRINQSTLTIRHCQIKDNLGSALYLDGGQGSLSSSHFFAENCSFTGNSAFSAAVLYIAGIDNRSDFTNCRFAGNSATAASGIFTSVSNSINTFTNCSFTGNSALRGGVADIQAGGFNNFTNCSFSGNNASGSQGGGAIYMDSSGLVSVTNCIFAHNGLAGDTTVPDASITSAGNNLTVRYSMVENFTAGDLNSLNGSSENNYDFEDPVFAHATTPTAAPTDTGDLAPLFFSPILDKGENSANPTTTDLASNNRFNSTIDLGAYEFSIASKIIYVDAFASGAFENGSTWTDAFTNLQDALEVAISDTQIWVAQGTYYPDEGSTQIDNDRSSTFKLKDGVSLYGSFPTGGGDGTFAARDVRSTNNETILSGDINDSGTFTGNAYHVVDGSDVLGAQLDGFTITAGHANGSFEDSRGGGLVSITGSPAITNCSFKGNSASTSGGAIFSSSSVLSLTNSSFQDNSAGSSAGAVYIDTEASTTLINCSFVGNSAGTSAGAIDLNESSLALTNCSFRGNSAGSSAGAICNRASNPSLANCILWNNSANGDTTTPSASITSDFDSDPTFSHCLIENYSKAELDGLGGNNNLDGVTDSDSNGTKDNDPFFASATDLRLLTSSPALNAGNNSSNSTTTDLAGNPRKVGTIDLGAYESQGFDFFYPGLDPSADDNGNGLSNYHDYAAGGDPTAADDHTLRTSIIGDLVTFSYRNNAADVYIDLEQSSSLATDSWFSMIEDIDYTFENSTDNKDQTLYTIELIYDPLTDTKMFYRQSFSTTK